MSRRTRHRRTRPRRGKGTGVSPPSRAKSQGKEHDWTERDIETLKELHAQRSRVAQATDEALAAPIAPTPAHWIKTPGELDVYGVDYPEGRIRRQHERRSKTAKATDLAKKAPLAPTPEEWTEHPEKYDLPGVDTPGRKKISEKPPRVTKRKNPLATPTQAKKYLADVVEKYRRRLGVKGDVKLSARNRGQPAKIIHSSDDKPSQIRVNYAHFAETWEADPELTKRYLEYAVAHELAHQKQIEELGFKGAQRADREAEAEVETDADRRAYKAIGTTEAEFSKVMDELAKKSSGEHATRHHRFKGKPDLSRFKDHTKPEKAGKPKAGAAPPSGKWYGVSLDELKRVPGIGDKTIEALRKAGYRDVSRVWGDSASAWKNLEAVDGIGEKTAKTLFKHIEKHVPPRKTEKPSTRDRMRALYVKTLGGAIPTATQEEIEAVAEKAISEEWIKPGDTAKTAMARVAEKAKAEFINLRQEKARKTREEQLKALKERAEKVKKTDEDRAREKLALVREEYMVQYETHLGAALSNLAVDKKRDLYNELVAQGVSKEDASKLLSEFNEEYIHEAHREALAEAKKEAASLAADAYGEAPELWEEAVQKTRAAEVAERPAAAAVEAEAEKLRALSRRVAKAKPPERPEAAVYDEATERIVRTILDAEAATRAEAEKRITGKITEAAGLLTTEAAASLVAADLGVERGGRLSPTEETRRRYDETMKDRVPRMVRTERADIRKFLLDQGFTVEEAKKYVDMMTADAVYTNQAEEITKRRAEIVPAHLTPEVKAERDALRAIQDEYEKVKKTALEEKTETPELSGKHRHLGEPTALTRPKGTKERQKYYKKALPYTFIHGTGMGQDVTVQGGEVKVRGMDPSHVAMMTETLPNRLGLPDGSYNIDTRPDEVGTVSLYRYPDRVEWALGDRYDGEYGDLAGEILITKGDKTVSLLVRHGPSEQELPEPRIAFNAETRIDVEKLKNLIDGSRGEIIRFMTYTDPENQDMLRAWWNEDRGSEANPISHEATLGPVTRLAESSSATYSRDYLEDLVEHLSRTGVAEARLSLSTDMPLRLNAEGPEYDIEYYLAPHVDMDTGEPPASEYHPGKPRFTLKQGDASKREWRTMAVPYTVFAQTAAAYSIDIQAEGDSVVLRGMDQDHVSMIEVTTANILKIPDGRYSSTSVDRGNLTTYRYPEELAWDPELKEIIVVKGKDQAAVRLDEEKEEIPRIKPGENVASVNLKTLTEAVDETWKAQEGDRHASLGWIDGAVVLEYEAEHFDEDTMERRFEKKTVDLGAYTDTPFDAVHYDLSRLRDHLKTLEVLDPDDVAISQNPDGVLTVEARKGDTVTRFHLAAMIGV